MVVHYYLWHFLAPALAPLRGGGLCDGLRMIKPSHKDTIVAYYCRLQTAFSAIYARWEAVSVPPQPFHSAL